MKSTSNHGDQSPSELELPGPCQQLNRNPLSVNVLLNINSAAIPTETQGHNKNQPLHNSDVPGSETQLQNSDNQIGFLPTPETPRLGALSNHMAGISAQSPVTNVTPPGSSFPKHTFTTWPPIQRLLNTSPTTPCSRLGASLLSGTWNRVCVSQEQRCKVSRVSPVLGYRKESVLLVSSMGDVT